MTKHTILGAALFLSLTALAAGKRCEDHIIPLPAEPLPSIVEPGFRNVLMNLAERRTAGEPYLLRFEVHQAEKFNKMPWLLPHFDRMTKVDTGHEVELRVAFKKIQRGPLQFAAARGKNIRHFKAVLSYQYPPSRAVHHLELMPKSVRPLGRSRRRVTFATLVEMHGRPYTIEIVYEMIHHSHRDLWTAEDLFLGAIEEEENEAERPGTKTEDIRLPGPLPFRFGRQPLRP